MALLLFPLAGIMGYSMVSAAVSGEAGGFVVTFPFFVGFSIAASYQAYCCVRFASYGVEISEQGIRNVGGDWVRWDEVAFIRARGGQECLDFYNTLKARAVRMYVHVDGFSEVATLAASKSVRMENLVCAETLEPFPEEFTAAALRFEAQPRRQRKEWPLPLRTAFYLIVLVLGTLFCFYTAGVPALIGIGITAIFSLLVSLSRMRYEDDLQAAQAVWWDEQRLLLIFRSGTVSIPFEEITGIVLHRRRLGALTFRITIGIVRNGTLEAQLAEDHDILMPIFYKLRERCGFRGREANGVADAGG